MKAMNVSCAVIYGCLLAASSYAADPLDIQAIDQTAADFQTANPAASLNYEDEILISQVGAANFARTEQFGNVNANASVNQQGDNNAVGVYQANGIGNEANILQQGNNNYGVITQAGDANIANISQYNDNNRFFLSQHNNNNMATVEQYGNSSMTLNQTGDQTANIVLQGTAQGSITQISPTLNISVSN